MQVKVHMLAFMDGETRMVEIPDGTEEVDILDSVFRNGQNEVQPCPDRCSVSMGDVIELDGRYRVVSFGGFKEIGKEGFEAYIKLPRRERLFSQYMVQSWEKPVGECNQ